MNKYSDWEGAEPKATPIVTIAVSALLLLGFLLWQVTLGINETAERYAAEGRRPGPSAMEPGR